MSIAVEVPPPSGGTSKMTAPETCMGIHVVWNTIRDAKRKRILERAVVDAIGDRPSGGHWDVKLTECDALPGWTAVVVAPDRTRVTWYFERHGVDDDPELVRLRMEILLSAVTP